MNTTIQNARAILGTELITVLKETCDGDEKAFKEIIDEAMIAYTTICREYGWKNTSPTDIE